MNIKEEVLKLVLLALEEGSALSRKVLVMFVVQRLEPHFPQASKTSIGIHYPIHFTHIYPPLFFKLSFKVLMILAEIVLPWYSLKVQSFSIASRRIRNVHFFKRVLS